MISMFTPMTFNTQDTLSLLSNQKTTLRIPLHNPDEDATNYLEVPEHLRLILMMPIVTPGPFAPLHHNETAVTGTAASPEEEETLYAWPPVIHQSSLFVQEAWDGKQDPYTPHDHYLQITTPRQEVHYKAGSLTPREWKPASTMPFSAARLQLTTESIRIEHLQSITEAEAILEGNPVDETGHAIWPGDDIPWSSARNRFATRWDEEHASALGENWNDNPFVWVVTFEVHHLRPAP